MQQLKHYNCCSVPNACFVALNGIIPISPLQEHLILSSYLLVFRWQHPYQRPLLSPSTIWADTAHILSRPISWYQSANINNCTPPQSASVHSSLSVISFFLPLLHLSMVLTDTQNITGFEYTTICGSDGLKGNFFYLYFNTTIRYQKKCKRRRLQVTKEI